MSRSNLAWALAAAMLAASPALAQTDPTTPAAQAPAPAPAETTPAAAPTAAPAASFLTQAEKGEYRASQLAGVNIYNSNDESIGEVSELLVDKGGTIKAVVIGVGGFLGIGQKNVALPYTAIKWEDKAKQSAAVGMAPGTPAAPGAPAAPGGAGGSTAAAPTVDNTVRDYPDHGILDMTKDQLMTAPDFEFASQAAK